MKNMKQLMSKFLALCIAGLLCFGFFGVDEVKAQTINTLKVATYNVESPRPNEPPDETLPEIVAEHIGRCVANGRNLTLCV